MIDETFVARPGNGRRERAVVVDFGPLSRFIADPLVTDVFVNGPRQVWVDRGSGPERHPDILFEEDGLRALAVRLVAAGGRHIDEASPCIDTRLGDGVRVHAVLPPLSRVGTLLSIRVPHLEPFSLDELQASGFFERVPLARVRGLVDARANLLITGAGGSGNTTWHL